MNGEAARLAGSKPPESAELLGRLAEAENEARALRAELAVLDRRLSSLESSLFLRLLRSTGGLTQTWTRRAGQLLLRSPLHPLFARLVGNARQAEPYAAWLDAHRARDPFRGRLPELPQQPPVFSVLVPTREPNPTWFSKCLESIRAQTYPYWQACIVVDAGMTDELRAMLEQLAGQDSRFVFAEGDGGGISSALNLAATLAGGDYLAFLDHDDTLEPTALAHFADQAVSRPVDIIYSDEDCIGQDDKPLRPLLKPSFSPNLLLRCMYMGHFLAVARQAFLAAGGFRPGYDGAQDFDLVLRLLDAGAQAAHIPRVLYHWREHPDSTSSGAAAKPYAHSAGARALTDWAARNAMPVRIDSGPRPFSFRLRSTSAPAAKATIIVPSRDARLLGRCLDALRGSTSGASFDVVVGHHRTGQPAAAFEAVLRRHAAASVDFVGSFNYSSICNRAAALATAPVLVFLNDDVTPLAPDWLESLLTVLHSGGVGIAGPRLFYPSGTLQHTGIAIGLCDGTGHPGRGLFDSSYWPWINCTRDVSAVSGACLAIHRHLFDQLGGFDEAFPVNYNDVDLCLRARRAGYSVVLDADSRLTHLEARTRTPGTTSLERLAFFRLWGHLLDQPDPFYSPNLDPRFETPSLAP